MQVIRRVKKKKKKLMKNSLWEEKVSGTFICRGKALWPATAPPASADKLWAGSGFRATSGQRGNWHSATADLRLAFGTRGGPSQISNYKSAPAPSPVPGVGVDWGEGFGIVFMLHRQTPKTLTRLAALATLSQGERIRKRGWYVSSP